MNAALDGGKGENHDVTIEFYRNQPVAARGVRGRSQGSGGRRQETGGRRAGQEAGGRDQGSGGTGQEAAVGSQAGVLGAGGRREESGVSLGLAHSFLPSPPGRGAGGDGGHCRRQSRRRGLSAVTEKLAVRVRAELMGEGVFCAQ